MPDAKQQMLAVIKQHKLAVPSSETKTMPEGLRKEVRNFVATYVGNYRTQVRNVRDIKRKEFLDKYRHTLTKDIIGNKNIKTKMNVFNRTMEAFKTAYLEVIEDERLSLSNSIYGFEKDDNQSYRVTISSNWVSRELDKKFNEQYNKGFTAVTELLDAFEKKIEEAIIFATISEVYKVVSEYSKFEPYMKKLGDLKIR